MHQTAPDVLRVWAESPLRVVRLGVREYKIVGDCIMFDMLPGLMLPYLDSSEPETKDPFRLVTKNREIVMQGENACTLPDVLWLILHRLNNAESHALTIGELCDPDGEEEAVWEIGHAPKTQVIRSYASKINSGLTKSRIVAAVRFSEKTNELSLHLPSTNDTEKPKYESDFEPKPKTETESPIEPKRGKPQKSWKRNADT